MSEKKNIKRNANRLKGEDRALYQSQQHSYYKPKPKKEVPELTAKLF